jgi:3-isopropylmalate/(R)-2-methylmalate dehydratase large subunit
MGKTLFEKIWNAHVVHTTPNGSQVIYIDRHFVHEVTSPQAFSEIDQKGIGIRQPEKQTVTADHNVPTLHQEKPIQEAMSRQQVATLGENCANHGLTYYGLGHPLQGIVHVIGPELGLTKPGMTIVCGDSHTSTHGAFGCVAFGIGTSQVAQVFASQCIIQQKPKTMRISIEGTLSEGVVAKDLILYIIHKLGTAGATGYFVEYAGSAIRNLSMEGRMTVCNMSIEMGARGGLIAPDQTTFDYLKGKKHAPQDNQWDQVVDFWNTLKTDVNASFDAEHTFMASDIEPMITYGTHPGMSIRINDKIPENKTHSDKGLEKALNYMGFRAGSLLKGQKIDYVFIGSCTNARIEDLRLVAEYIDGQVKAPGTIVWVIPGSKQVEKQAIEEGLDVAFNKAGFEFRQPGCSACLGMNEDKIPAGAYCVSTSNRNFEGRQGQGARTILASPLTAAAAAIAGKIVDFRTSKKEVYETV